MIESAPPVETISQPSRRQSIVRALRGWLTTWELYPILAVAIFTHFYLLGSTEFDEDQATLFDMARNAVVHGMLPVTGNLASIRIVNPPAAIYLFMIPAAISANPLGGAILVATLNVIAVVLTYVFIRRYFGRVAGIVAALLYATATKPVGFGRFIWQPTMMAPFIVLFFFALFWGAVERRKGWLFPALLLLGLLVQMHEIMALLALPLLLAFVFAPTTVRWGDIAFGLLGLLVLFAPYLIWQVATHFRDVTILLTSTKQRVYFDNTALIYYRDFFSPYSTQSIPSDPHTLLYQLLPEMMWLRRILLLLVIGGFIAALLWIVIGFFDRRAGFNPSEQAHTNPAKPARFSGLAGRWERMLPAPLARGLMLLLVWQVVFLIVLSRHSVPVVLHYLLAVMPGPFFLMGVFAGSVADWLRAQKQWAGLWKLARYGLYLFLGTIIVTQTVGTTADLIDQVNRINTAAGGQHSLSTLQYVFQTADSAARKEHLSHVYITSTVPTQSALWYLADQMQTPTTVFDGTRCLVLPNPADGPAVVIVDAKNTLMLSLLSQYATLTPVNQSPQLGGGLYQMYIAQPNVLPSATGANLTFGNNLRSLDGRVQVVSADNRTFMASAWGVLKPESASYRTTYTYTLTASFVGGSLPSTQTQCIATSLRTGDEIVAAFSLPANTGVPTAVSVAAQYFIDQPYALSLGPIPLENIRLQRVGDTSLLTRSGANRITLQGM
jgi:4-amino-4-deoxy-L-arabinose transferase-like glycosyltransferase